VGAQLYFMHLLILQPVSRILDEERRFPSAAGDSGWLILITKERRWRERGKIKGSREESEREQAQGWEV